MTPTPTNPPKTSHPLTRSAMRWTTRLSAAVLLASAGLTATATQAPAPVAAHLRDDAAVLPAVDSGGDALVTVLKQASVSSPAAGSSLLEVSPGLDVPAPALRAYRFAESVMRTAAPACRLDWSLLAAIGDVESHHGRYGGAEVRPAGTSTPHILGPRLDGGGEFAAIADTDDGDLDGDRRWDRAVGPMQFIPSTWAVVGADADGDEVRNPHDVDDAALAAAAYLCAGDADLSTTAGQEDAVYRYNNSASYVDLVLRLAAAYAENAFALAQPQPTVRAASHAVAVPSLQRPVEVGAHPAQPAGRSLGVRESADSGVGDRQRHRADRPDRYAESSSSATSAGRSGAASGTAGGDDGGTASTRDGGGPVDTTGGGSTDSTEVSRSGSTAQTDGGGTDSGDGTSSGSTGGSGSASTTGDDTTGDSDGGSTADGSTDGDSTEGDSTDDEATDDEATDGGSGDGGSTDDGSTDDGSGGTGDGDTTERDPSKSLSGELTHSDGGRWFVAGTAVDFGDEAYLAAEALNDFDSVDGVESNSGELETLIHDDVSVVIEGDAVQELNGMAYR